MPDETLTQALKDDLAEGLTYRAISAKRGIPLGTLALWLPALKVKPQTDKQTPDGQIDKQAFPESLQGSKAKGQGRSSETGFQAPSDHLDKASARKTLNEIALGHREGDASQMAALKLVLKDELEPETESNPYAGTPEEELGERALVLACSVLGYRSVVARLRELGKAEMLDLLGDEDAEPTEALELDRPVVATSDDEMPHPSSDALRGEATPPSLSTERTLPRVRTPGALEVQELGEIES